ncbi:hypothetical protein BLNAU_3072 [Blattamonas nauphoetae]|uniref:Uncharacterized protein n=1 Tax=Blattamonas nauphoetae TaxID=2049346 RepID=A0ABQ9YEE7_9EUKA|nr:hypothetical protein BLNAU_3072 [Blattamonas nauphoetae]
MITRSSRNSAMRDAATGMMMLTACFASDFLSSAPLIFTLNHSELFAPFPYTRRPLQANVLFRSFSSSVWFSSSVIVVSENEMAVDGVRTNEETELFPESTRSSNTSSPNPHGISVDPTIVTENVLFFVNTHDDFDDSVGMKKGESRDSFPFSTEHSDPPIQRFFDSNSSKFSDTVPFPLQSMLCRTDPKSDFDGVLFEKRTLAKLSIPPTCLIPPCLPFEMSTECNIAHVDSNSTIPVDQEHSSSAFVLFEEKCGFPERWQESSDSLLDSPFPDAFKKQEPEQFSNARFFRVTRENNENTKGTTEKETLSNVVLSMLTSPPTKFTSSKSNTSDFANEHEVRISWPTPVVNSVEHVAASRSKQSWLTVRM